MSVSDDVVSAGSPRRFGSRIRWWELVALRALADLAAIGLAFALARGIHLVGIERGWMAGPASDGASFALLTGLFALVTIAVFAQQGLYRGRATVLNLWELETAVVGVMLSAALVFALLFFLDLVGFSRGLLVGAIGLSALLLILERRGMSALARKLQLAGLLGRRTLVYGCDRTGQLLMKKTLEAPQLGSRVVGFLDDQVPVGSQVRCRIDQTDPTLFEAPVLGRFEDLEELVPRHDVDEVLVVEAALGSERQREAIRLCDRLGISLGVVPSLGDVRSDQLRIEEMSAIPVLRPHRPPSRRAGKVLKRAFDLVAASFLIVITAPVWALTVAMIRLEGADSALFTQQRVGKDGTTFRMYKFRTMRSDAPPYASSPPGDGGVPTITRAGRILRKTGIDELPQLINVLRGEMSLVGPRPEMPHLVQEYGPLERKRLRVRPGITGLWQLSPDRHAEIHENIEYDLYYVHHQSFLLDMLVLLETLLFTLGIVVGLLDRRSAREGAPALAPQKTLPPGTEEGYVLVALDQRIDGALPGSWRLVVPAALSVADRWPVRIVVAENNREAVDRMTEASIGPKGGEGRNISFPRYRSRSDLRRLTRKARLVITDLPHVAGWTEEEEIDLLSVERSGVRWWPRSRVPDPIVSDLSKHVTVYVGPQEEEREAVPHLSVVSFTGS
ncbi:MAG: sugar transferase [Gemmatimonadota bacterium]|nr:sugar transferase [Gemmatimonadota bacterium]